MPFDKQSIYKLLVRGPSSYSTSSDGIPFSFIKEVAAEICSPLEYLFTASFAKAEIPDRWKHSLVTPILKKNPSDVPTNYRPEGRFKLI
ncbi:hypothetical protein Y032_0671g1377 [Ancylostoma ceylanicum]|nr:hypothetical protein Y032_0671g1377 [Ancylostoma ceylanicum]